jgi:hypothetical protein
VVLAADFVDTVFLATAVSRSDSSSGAARSIADARRGVEGPGSALFFAVIALRADCFFGAVEFFAAALRGADTCFGAGASLGVALRGVVCCAAALRGVDFLGWPGTSVLTAGTPGSR